MTTLCLPGNDSQLRATFARYAAQAVGVTLLDDCPADAVIVIAPAPERLALVRQTAAYARAVLCPLPFASSADEALEAIHDCAARGVLLYPALSLRFLPVLGNLRQVIQTRQLGRLLSVKIIYETRRAPAQREREARTQQSASLALTELPPALDLLLWLTGDTVGEVRVCHARSSPSAAMLLSLSLAGGAYALLDVARALPDSYPLSENLRIEVIGTEGAAQSAPFCQPIHTYHAKAVDALWATDPLREMLFDFVTAAASGQDDHADTIARVFQLAQQIEAQDNLIAM